MQHHNFKKGQKIYIILKDGTKIIGKFEEKKSKAMIIKDENSKKTRINFSDIRSSTIYNPSNYK